MNKLIEKPVLVIVVPCFNESAVLPRTIKQLLAMINDLAADKQIDDSSFIYCVDDGSSDGTWEIITSGYRADPRVKGIKLAANVGHQYALLAGLLGVKGQVDCAISIDADLQQDEKAIRHFVEKYRQGKDIVFGVRKDRNCDSLLKKVTARLFYKVMRLAGTQVIENHADYRLISKPVIEALSRYGESNLFLRGIFASMGFSSDTVHFDTKRRDGGKSKYSTRKMISFALNGITSFSIFPLRVIAFIGFVIFIISALMGLYVLIEALIIEKNVPGWASTVLPIYLLGGIQVLSLGIIGEYVGKIYKETKARPRFIIEKEC